MARKSDIVKAVRAATGLNKKEATDAVSTVFNEILISLAQGDEVTISGFGKFKNVHKDEQKVRNPMTGEFLNTHAHNKPQFAFSEYIRIAFRDNMQNQYLEERGIK